MDFERQGMMAKNPTRSFCALMVTQFFGAFNDSVFQVVVVLLAVQWILDPGKANQIVSLSGFVFAAPFLLFSFISGRIADRFSKNKIILVAKSFDLLVVTIAIAGVVWHSVPLLLIGLFFLALQSTFFGPSKYGILPELKTEQELPGANALINVALFIALLTGTIGGTFYAHRMVPLSVMMGFAALASFVGALLIEKMPEANPNQPLQWNPFPDIIGNWRLIQGDRALRLSLAAVAYFWFIGGVFHLNMLVYLKSVMHLGDQFSGYIFSSMVIGIALGSVVAGKLSQGKVELGLVPIGAVGITIFTLDLYFSHGSFTRTLIDVFLLGMNSGIYVIPLNTLIQLRSPTENRGRILAMGNFMSFIAIALASGFLWLTGTLFKANPAGVFLTLSFLSLCATVAIYFYLPQAFVRLVLYLLTNTIYRIKVIGRENIPIRGPALLVPNHVSMIDPFLLAGGLSRLIRFIMFREMYEKPLIRHFVKFMDEIPISEEDNPKEIMRSLLAARKKLKEGHLVCIFAEGQISRQGGFLMGFKRGMEVIMRGLDDVPVIPVHLEGVWGSIFSFEAKKWIWKWPRQLPYPVTITFGKPLFKVAPHEIRQAVMDLGSEAFSIHRQKSPTLFESFLAQAERFPGQKIVSDSTGKNLSYRELLAAATIVGQQLNSDNLAGPNQPYPAVGVLLPPSVGGVIANLALCSQGFIPVNLNYTLPREMIRQIMEKSGIQKVISSQKMIDKMGWSDAKDFIFLESILHAIPIWKKLCTGLTLRALPSFFLRKTFFKRSSGNLDDLATIMFTSGSTGIPKGVVLTQGNILSNIQAITMVLNLDPTDAILGILPFFHSFGFTATLWFPLLTGLKAVYHSNPLDSKMVGELCRKEQVTFLVGTPTFLSAYLFRIEKEDFESLRFVMAGAEKLRPDFAKAFEEKYSIPILEGYGCTELSPVVALNVPDTMDGEVLQVGRKVGKVGRPLPGISIKIVDPETGARLNPGQQGLLLVKGPNVMKEYFGEPEKTRETIKDGWYVTGDIATIDDDGFIEITDRLSRFSKIGGEMVPHILVEQKLHEASASIERVFVVTSVPDGKKGEALAVLVAGFQGELDQIWKDLNTGGLPKLWIPSRDKFFTVESIPTLGSGKIDMLKVKEMANTLASTASQ